MHKSLIAVAVLLAVPTLALAGKKATAGDQTLQVSSSLTPAKAGGKGVKVKLSVDYESTNDNAQVKEYTKSVAVVLPAGTKFHTDVGGQCKYSELSANGPDSCPATSVVGAGNATADARPAAPDPVTADVTLFNGLDDTNPDGTPRDPAVPALLLYAKTSIPGVDVTLAFDIKGSSLETDYAPPQPGEGQLFHLQTVDVTLPKGKPSYVTSPRKCGKPWKTSVTIANYDGPSVTATSTQKCHK